MQYKKTTSSHSIHSAIYGSIHTQYTIYIKNSLPFSRISHKMHLNFFLIIALYSIQLVFSHSSQQLYANDTFPFSNTLGPAFINEYVLEYPYVPFEVQNYEFWLKETKTITQYLGFHTINARVKYLDEQDTTYFEYILKKDKQEIPGKLFVLVSGGTTYQILDVRFVPYHDLRKVMQDDDTEPQPQSASNLSIDKEPVKTTLPSDLEIITNEPVDDSSMQEKNEIPEEDYENTDPIAYPQIIPSTNEPIDDSSVQEKNEILKEDYENTDPIAYPQIIPSTNEPVDDSSVQEKNEIPEEDYENTDPIAYPQIIPSTNDAKNGVRLFLNVALLDEDKRKTYLVRYDDKKKQLFNEEYVYTSKGALQRLVRSHANGSNERFIYYFSTGGLKEVFYQDRDGSSYVLRYTLGGDLSEKQIRDRSGKVKYDERNQYTKKGTLTSKIEVDYLSHLYQENTYRNGKLQLKKVYTIRNKKTITTTSQNNEDSSTETRVLNSILGPLPQKQNLELLYEENFRYNNKGDATGISNRDVLNERVTISQYDDEGVLTKDSHYLNGELEFEVVYSDEDSKQEIFYFKNEPILKIYYQNNSKIKEEVLKK